MKRGDTQELDKKMTESFQFRMGRLRENAEPDACMLYEQKQEKLRADATEKERLEYILDIAKQFSDSNLPYRSYYPQPYDYLELLIRVDTGTLLALYDKLQSDIDSISDIIKSRYSNIRLSKNFESKSKD